MDEQKKCTVCKKQKDNAEFVNRHGKSCRICSACRYRGARYKLKQKCEHGREKHHCRDCSGSCVCPHNRQKHECRDCGTGYCEHGRTKRSCADCKGNSRCHHNKLKQICHECGGVTICAHGLQKQRCRKCQGVKAAIRVMIQASRNSDKNRNRFDAANFIDQVTLQVIFDNNPELICQYCNEQMELGDIGSKLVTIERLDNSIGHTKTNCTICCFDCNLKHRNRGFRE